MLRAASAALLLACAAPVGALAQAPAHDAPDEVLLDDLSERTFRFFWETTDHETGLTPDRHPTPDFSSVASIGFALNAYGIGVERGWVSREDAAERTRNTLKYLYELPQGPEESGTAGHKGFFYHFLDYDTGHRHAQVELSTVDTALLLAGALFAESYFDGDDPVEAEIRDYTGRLFDRVDWAWAQNNAPAVSLGWHPETGFIEHDWIGYNESMIVYIIALGAEENGLDPDAWEAWTSGYDPQWSSHHGEEHLQFSPLFGHQFSHAWVDFRGIHDAYMAERGIDYFENSRRASVSQYNYANANPMGWQGYGGGVWGITACDGPGPFELDYQGETREFRGYSARGPGYPDDVDYDGGAFDDGTIAPTAALGSFPFTPELSMEALRAFLERWGDDLYGEYGFWDAINPSFTYTDVELERGNIIEGVGWVAHDHIGIDQGAILTMVENHRSGLIWNVMRENPRLRRGLERAGFTGGWLDGEAP